MMPFAPEFDSVIAAIRAACTGVSLECMRVDDLGEDSTIIQDIFCKSFGRELNCVRLTPESGPNLSTKSSGKIGSRGETGSESVLGFRPDGAAVRNMISCRS